MQSTGQASTQAVSLVPMQGSAITYAMDIFSPVRDRPYHSAEGKHKAAAGAGCLNVFGNAPARLRSRLGKVAFISQRLPSRGAVAQSNNVTVFSRRQWPLR